MGSTEGKTLVIHTGVEDMKGALHGGNISFLIVLCDGIRHGLTGPGHDVRLFKCIEGIGSMQQLDGSTIFGP